MHRQFSRSGKLFSSRSVDTATNEREHVISLDIHSDPTPPQRASTFPQPTSHPLHQARRRNTFPLTDTTRGIGIPISPLGLISLVVSCVWGIARVGPIFLVSNKLAKRLRDAEDFAIALITANVCSDLEPAQIHQEYKLCLKDIGERLQAFRKDKQSLWDHIKGLREIMTIRGHIKNLHDEIDEATARYKMKLTIYNVASITSLDEKIEETRRDGFLRDLSIAAIPEDSEDLYLEGTRTVFLNDASTWATSVESNAVFLLIAEGGLGKTTVAVHLSRGWRQKGSLLGIFRFSYPSITNGDKLASTLTHQMASNIPSLRRFVAQAVERHSNFRDLCLVEQLECIVFSPLREMTVLLAENRADAGAEIRELYDLYIAYLTAVERELTRIYIISIDGLDECHPEHRILILQSLFRFTSSFEPGQSPVKFFLTCRPEQLTLEEMKKNEDQIYHPDALSNLKYSKRALTSREDIALYASMHLSDLRFTSKEIESFVDRADCSFIWTAIAVRLLQESYAPDKCLEDLLNPDKGSGLDGLFKRILHEVWNGKGEEDRQMLQKVLKCICHSPIPLSPHTIDKLLCLRNGVTAKIGGHLRSVLSYKGDGKMIGVIHQTLIEYIHRSTLIDPLAFSEEEAHHLMAEVCLDILCSKKIHWSLFTLDLIDRGLAVYTTALGDEKLSERC
ncbi:hypothetical protein CPB86DRAFT_848978 [Serendipita vermifera]|nr:hypothetical protein CPB86DRAFT_848978 [Serendipita vermifera]